MLNIITGAGNHSEDEAILKPFISDYLRKNDYSINDINHGKICVHL